MKILLSLLSFILLCSVAHAQNYQCVQTNTVNYFTNSDHYLRAIRIDSVKTKGVNTVLYPFKTARGENYMFTNKYPLRPGGSWLGETITILPDGTHRFENYRGDTVVINTQARLNDSWIFYDDTSANYYIATVTSLDTMTVLGVMDSVKIITLTAMHILSVVPTDILNNRRIIISKNHGFVQTVDLFIFPKQGTGFISDFDYFTEKAGAIDFILSDFYNPDKLEIYDFQPGDVFQYKSGDMYPLANATVSSGIIYRNAISSVEVEYIIRRIVHGLEFINNKYVVKTNIDTISRKIIFGKLFDMSKLPEEWGMGRFFRFNPADTKFCKIDKSYSSSVNFVTYQNDSASVNTFEPCSGPNYEYKIGLGETDYSWCFDPTGKKEYQYLFFLNKNGNPCGPFQDLSIEKSDKQYHVIIYPNPALDDITIEIPVINQPVQLLIYDLSGKIIYEGHTQGNHTKIPVSGFNNGYYLLRLISPDGSQSNHKIVVQH